MSYIPNVRDKFVKTETLDKTVNNEHWEGYLNNPDANYVAGYDYATGTMMNMLDHLVLYEHMFKLAGIDVFKVDKSIMDEDKNLDEYTDSEIDEMNQETLFFKAIQSGIIQFAEQERDDLIVDMIDEMPSSEYFAIKQDVDKNGTKNVLLKTYE